MIETRRKPPRARVNGVPICPLCYRAHGLEAPAAWAIKDGPQWIYRCNQHVGERLRHISAPGPWNGFRGVADAPTTPGDVERQGDSRVKLVFGTRTHVAIVRAVLRGDKRPVRAMAWHLFPSCPFLDSRKPAGHTPPEFWAMVESGGGVIIEGHPFGRLCKWCCKLEDQKARHRALLAHEEA